ncbi:MAG: hypothetical protein AB7I79_15165 [Rhizobiaceae bacterium]
MSARTAAKRFKLRDNEPKAQLMHEEQATANISHLMREIAITVDGWITRGNELGIGITYDYAPADLDMDPDAAGERFATITICTRQPQDLIFAINDFGFERELDREWHIHAERQLP